MKKILFLVFMAFGLILLSAKVQTPVYGAYHPPGIEQSDIEIQNAPAIAPWDYTQPSAPLGKPEGLTIPDQMPIALSHTGYTDWRQALYRCQDILVNSIKVTLYQPLTFYHGFGFGQINRFV